MKRLLYLVMAVVIVLAVSCKQDTPTNNNLLVVDGGSMNIVEASICQNDLDNDHFYIKLCLPDQSWMRIVLDGKTHFGKTIDLSQNDAPDLWLWYWSIEYFNIDLGVSINSDGNPSSTLPPFTRGTLFSERLPDKNGNPVLHLELNDGEYDGHTISLYFKGKVKPYYDE